MKVVIIDGTSDDKIRAEILPIANLPEIEEIFLVRRQPLRMPKVTSYAPPAAIRRILILAEPYRLFSLIYIGLIKKPDIYIGIYFILHGLFAWIAGRLFGKPVIQYLIGTDRPKVEASKLFLRILNDAQFVGVRGKASENQLVNLGIKPEKFFVPTGVNVLDFEHFKPSLEKKNYDLIYIGRLDKNKQVQKIIRAAGQVFQARPNLKVSLVGDGPERSILEKLVIELGLVDVVTFLGSQPYDEVPNRLNEARIFMMASDFEGLPVAMLEALCCGLPVVVPNVGDILDVARHGENALVVDPPSVDGFAQALSALLADRFLYSRLASGALASREKFMIEYSIDRAEEIWRSVLSTKIITKKGNIYK